MVLLKNSLSQLFCNQRFMRLFGNHVIGEMEKGISRNHAPAILAL